MNPTAVFSKSGKGVQEASGKTSLLSRADRAVLSAFDGRLTVGEVAERLGKPFDPKFAQLVGQLEKGGFVRQVSAGVAPSGAAAAHGPAARAPVSSAAEELDFTLFAAPKAPASPKPAPPPVDLAAKGREEAERKAKAEHAASYKARQEIERARMEAEARNKAAAQARMHAEAAAKARAEADAKGKAGGDAGARAKAAEAESLRAETEAKVKAAREAAVRAAAEAKAKAEAELQEKLEAERARAKEEAERIRREAEDKARREAEAFSKRLEAERKAREEAERIRREAEEQAKREAEELRQRLEEERKAREAAEAARKKAEEQAKEEERRRREAEERRLREEAERRAREEEERRAREQAEREAREEKARAERESRERAEREQRERAEKDRAEREEQERAREEQERAEKEEREQREKAAREEARETAPAAPSGSFDSLLADLDSFGKREEHDRKDHGAEEAQKKKAAQAKADAERAAQAEAKQAREREEEREAVASLAASAQDDDIGVTDEDLDMDDVKKDQKALSQQAQRAAREREREQEREERQRERERALAREGAAPEPVVEAPAAPARIRRPMKLGKPLAIAFVILLVAAIAAVHVMPIPTADYEKAASDAFGAPVKIGAARVSLVTGLQLKLDKVTVGSATISHVRAHPTVGSLFGEKKSFKRVELEGVTMPQQAIGAMLRSSTKGASFEVARLQANNVKLEGPLALPALDADFSFGADGAMKAGTLRGPDNLTAKLVPNGSQVEFEMNAMTFSLPVAPEISLNQFGMKGVARQGGMEVPEWSATLYDGVLSGNAKLAWGSTFSLEGTVTVRAMNVAVFAPALLSEGKGEGTGRFSMSGADASKLGGTARLEGNFNITKGVLGSFDIARAISTDGRQASGRTPFAEMVGQGVYDKGAVQLRNVTIGAGALNAGASADIAQGGALSGRIVADVKAPTQTLRTTLNLGGTVKEPQVRN